MFDCQLHPLEETNIQFIDGDRGVNYPKKPELLPSGECLFLNAGNVTSSGFIFESVDFITAEKDQKLRKGKAMRGDIIITTRGTVGNVAFYSEKIPFDHIRINSGMVIVRTDGEEYVPYFLYLFFRSELFKKQCLTNGSGSAQPQLPISALINISLPKIGTKRQRKISNAIKVIDEKIELNNKINAELEAMAKLIYDYWFVQFDFPDANGKPYKSSGGKMVFNEALKREIPDGWCFESLADIEPNIITGKTPSTKKPEYFNGNVPFICIGDVRGNMHITKTELTLSEVGADSQANKFIPEGAICVTCIASPGLVGFATENSQTNQQLNTVVCSQFDNQYFLYFYLKDYFRFAKAKSGNTFANMNKGDFSEINVINPRKEVLETFANKLQSTMDKILINSKENNKLSELRDWLLPMLMNGQVTVNDSKPSA